MLTVTCDVAYVYYAPRRGKLPEIARLSTCSSDPVTKQGNMEHRKGGQFKI